MGSWGKVAKRGLLVVLALAVLGGVGGGAWYAFLRGGDGGRPVAVSANMVGCVYSSLETGHRFVRSIQPGERVSIGKTDQLVVLPTSDEIYHMTAGANHTQEAPGNLLAFTKGQTAVWVQGVLRFRLNTTGDKACRFYSKYGNGSYGNLGYVVLDTGERQGRGGWYRFLAETVGDLMKQVVHDGSSGWTWQQLAYGSDPTVKLPAGASEEPISVTYGRHIGSVFTKYLRLDLGDNYFCGVQPGLTGAGELPGCPAMYFQLLSVAPRDKSLSDEHDALKRLDAELTRQRQAAKLKAMNRATAIASAKAQRKVLKEEILNTKLEAQNDLKIQKCLILAGLGLDCDGHKASIVVGSVAGAGG